MNISFIEPCCAEKQLPLLIKNSAQGILPFQTNGDVTFEHFIKSLSCLAGNKIDITLAVHTIDIAMLRVLAWLFRRGWLCNLHILTNTDQSQLVHNELAEMAATLHCYHHDRVTEDMLIIDGEQASVILQGHLTSDITPAHRFYYTYFTRTEDNLHDRLTKTLHTLMRNEDKPQPKEENNPKGEEKSEEGRVEKKKTTQKNPNSEAQKAQ